MRSFVQACPYCPGTTTVREDAIERRLDGYWEVMGTCGHVIVLVCNPFLPPAIDRGYGLACRPPRPPYPHGVSDRVAREMLRSSHAFLPSHTLGPSRRCR